jgi:hypothetical protein
MNIPSTILRALRGAHAILAIAGALSLLPLVHGASPKAPNVIFFATDDLCDWVGPLAWISTDEGSPKQDADEFLGCVRLNLSHFSAPNKQ